MKSVLFGYQRLVRRRSQSASILGLELLTRLDSPAVLREALANRFADVPLGLGDPIDRNFVEDAFGRRRARPG